MRHYPFSMVYMTDRIIDNKEYCVSRNDAEGNSRQVAYSIRDALISLCDDVVMFETIEPYIERLPTLKNHVMFSTRYGVAYPSSKALVPAICEANNVRFIGADSYTQMLCNDKFLSKKYIEEFGLRSAPSVLIRNAADPAQIAMMSFLRFPVVVKPNYGGGSNGITEDSVQQSLNGAIEYVRKLQEYQNQPILVEEYVPGYEVEAIVFGNQHRILLCSEQQIVLNGEEYFTDKIYDLSTKKINVAASEMVRSSLINNADKEAMCRLFQSFNKAEFMRIDCRVYNGHAYILELSPDCYLGRDGGVYGAFEELGFEYPEMFSLMIQNALYPGDLSEL